MPHTIRLNSAWELRLLKELPAPSLDDVLLRDNNSPVAHINLPCTDFDEVNLKAAAAILLTRRFNRPSNLAPEQPISLLVEGIAVGAGLYINGEGADVHSDTETFSVDISERLRDNNRIDIVLRHPSRLLPTDVRLAIYEA